MKFFKKIIIASSVFSVLFFAGCSHRLFDQLEHIEKSESGEKQNTYISVCINKASRTALPEPVSEFSDFVLKGVYTGESIKTLGSYKTLEELSSAKIAVREGDWRFILSAKCRGSILRSEIDVEVVTGQNTLNFTLGYSSYGGSSDKGAFEVSIKVPESVKAVKACLNTTDGNIISEYEDELLEIDENHLACYKKEEVFVNTYVAKVSLYGDEAASILLNSVEDIIVIAAGSLSKDFIEIESVNEVYEISLENLKDSDTFTDNFKKFYTRQTNVTLPVPKRENHTFLGWFENETKVDNWTPGERLSDVTFTAKWQYDGIVEKTKGIPSLDSVKLSWTVPEHDVFFKKTRITFEDNTSIDIEKAETSEYEVTGLSPDIEYTFYISAISVDGLEGKKFRVKSTPGTELVSIKNLANYLEANKAMNVIPVCISDSEITRQKIDGLNLLLNNSELKVALDLSLVDSFDLESGVTCSNWNAIVSLKLGGHIDSTKTGFLFNKMTNLRNLEIADNSVIKGDYMFNNSESLEKLIIGNNCYIDSSRMFDGSGLKNVEAGSDVVFYNGRTFISAKNLESVILGEGCNLGPDLFYECSSLEEIVLPEGIKDIPEKCFYNTAFESFKIPETVTEIGMDAFYNCQNLKSVELPESVENINHFAFKNCGNLKSIDLSHVKTINNGAFENSGLESIALPALINVSDSCFSGCTKLREVTLGKSIKNILDNAFNDCISLKNLFIPTSVDYIDGSAFSNCDYIVFEVSEGNKEFSASDDGKMLLNKARTTLILFPGAQGDISETFPDTLVLKAGTFKNNSKITKVKIPGGMTSVPYECFYGCSALKEVDLNNATEICEYAFSSCDSLCSIDVSEVTVFERGAFIGCINLTDIDLSKVKKIENNAFYMGTSYTGNLGNIDLSNIEYLGSNVFVGAGLKEVILPENFSYTSEKGLLHGAFAKNPEIKFMLSETAQNFTTIENGKILLSKDKKVLVAYPGASGEIIIPDFIETIGSYAFYYSDITGVTVPSNIKVIEPYAFQSAQNVIKINIEEGLEKIDYCAFFDCGDSELVITVPSSVTYIGRQALELHKGKIRLTETEGWTATNYRNPEDKLDLSKYNLKDDFVIQYLFKGVYESETGYFTNYYTWTREPADSSE